jgi:signal transduction histidine kinase/ligand-binding sensor domain-containing protein
MRKRLFNLLAYLFFCAACSAQQYPFVHYTPKDGLVNSRVRKALQDSKGRMYFLTYSGLSIYDGTRFKNYTMEDGLLSNLLNDVLEVGPDSFLVSTNTTGLNVLVRGKIKMLELKTTPPIVNEFLRDNKGVIYASTDDGLYKLTAGNLEKMSDYFAGHPEPVMYLGNIAEYRDWLVFTTNDLRHYTGLFLYHKPSNKIIDCIPGVMITDLKQGPDGNIWVGEKTLTVLDPVSLSAGKLVLKEPAHLKTRGSSMPINVLFNRQKELVVFSGNQGIYYYKKDGSYLHVGSPEPTQYVVQTGFIDRENVLWICYDGNGVYKLVNTKFNATNDIFGVNSTDIQQVATLGDSTWLTTASGKWLVTSTDRADVVTTNLGSYALPVHVTKKYIYAVQQRQLYRAPNTPKSLFFKPILTIPDTSGFAYTTVIDPYGNLYVYERYNIRVLDEDNKLISKLPIPNYDLVHGMYIRENNKFWIVTRSTGLRVFSIHPGDSAGYFKLEHQFLREFENASPRCTVIDKQGILWIGTRNHGLFSFILENNKLRKLHHFRIHNGLTDNFVTSLACDNANNIIVGSQTGLDRLVKQDDGSYRIENITRRNNIFSYVMAVWTDKHNNAYAITNAKTVLHVQAVEPPVDLTEPYLLLEEMKVNGELVSSVDGQRLRYLQRNINFHIASPTFIDEKQVQYSYRLKGSGNNEWSEPGTTSDIVLLNLTPGKYTLEVIASFPSTSYQPKQLSYSFEILPPWWETWWFRLAMGSLVILAAMYAIRFYYRRKLEKQMTLLEKQQAIEKERTRIATDMHDDLGAGLSRIKFLSETIGIKKQKQIPIEDDISSIRQYSHEMIDKMGEIVWALNERNDSLSDLLSYTRAYAVEYLSQNGIQCVVNAPDLLPAGFVSGEYRRNIYLAVKEALHNIVKHAGAQQVMINVELNQWLVITIADDGAGFTTNDIQPYSNGLANMKKRMADIGGSLEIIQEKGTTIRLKAPIP